MECAGLTIENKSTGCREQEYQVLGTEVPGIGNRSTRHCDNRIESQPAKEHRCITIKQSPYCARQNHGAGSTVLPAGGRAAMNSAEAYSRIYV